MVRDKTFTEEDYINKSKELGNEYVGYYRSGHDSIIKYICAKHKQKGVQEAAWGHYSRYKNPCPYCSGRYRTTEEAQAMVMNPNIELISEYVGSEKPIKCRCRACGTIWVKNRPIDLFKRPGGCPTCGPEVRRAKRAKTQEQFESDLMKVNPNIRVLGEYKNTHTPIKCRCLLDGSEWESYPANLLNQSAGCPICNLSFGERMIVRFLDYNHISYTRQKTFKDLKDKKRLKFDVFDEDNRIAIEFQGEQHYMPVDFETNNPEKAQRDYEALLKRDKMKRDYCLKNGIKLVCIPYWERNNITNYLLENVEEYKERDTA